MSRNDADWTSYLAHQRNELSWTKFICTGRTTQKLADSFVQLSVDIQKEKQNLQTDSWIVSVIFQMDFFGNWSGLVCGTIARQKKKERKKNVALIKVYLANCG